jgi:nicotinamidase-related amidase
MLNVENTILVVIDVQEKLSRLIYQRDKIVANLQKLIQGIKVLGIPIILTEQYPQGLGPTIPEITALLPDVQPLSKLSFSCYGDEHFVRELENSGRTQVLVSGIETHVCVYQTVADLLNNGYEVHLAVDTVSSRTPENREVGINKISQAGALLTSTETALFELLKVAKGEQFKAISRIVK